MLLCAGLQARVSSGAACVLCAPNTAVDDYAVHGGAQDTRNYEMVQSICTCLLGSSFLPDSMQHSMLLGSLRLVHLFRLQV